MKLTNYFNWPGNIWLFSDPHFGDESLMKVERVEFSTIEEHDKTILRNIRKRVSKDDTLICLGDLGYNWQEKIQKIKSAKKILVMGNHDKLAKSEYKKYFDEIFTGPVFINKFVVLSHEPIPVGEQFINIHGHLHSAHLDTRNHINISARDNKYEPFSISNINKKIETMPRIKAKFLEEWYADNYIFDSDRTDVPVYEDGHIIPAKEFDFLSKYNYSYRDMGKFKFNRFGESLERQLSQQIEEKPNVFLIKLGNSPIVGYLLVTTDLEMNIKDVIYSDVGIRLIKNVHETTIELLHKWDPVVEKNFPDIKKIDDSIIIEKFDSVNDGKLYFEMNHKTTGEIRVCFIIN